MEPIPPRIQDKENPSSAASPNSNGSCSSTANCPHFAPAPPPIVRSEDPNPYPTTFVQADASNFKHVVQMLTGSSDAPAKQPTNADLRRGGGGSVPPIKSTSQKKPGFKLYERRSTLKQGLMINTFANGAGFSPRKPEILSPSILDIPSLVLTPATPLNQDWLAVHSPVVAPTEEEKAIAEKKFYLHPSPPPTPRDSEPQLLSLFPIASPRVPRSSS